MLGKNQVQLLVKSQNEEQNLKNAFDRIEGNLIKDLTNLVLKKKALD